MPFSDTEDDEHLSEPDDRSSSEASGGSSSDDDCDSDSDGNETEDSGRGASDTFTSPSTFNDTSTRTSGSLAAALLLQQHSGDPAENGGGAAAAATAAAPGDMTSQESANHPLRLFQSQPDAGEQQQQRGRDDSDAEAPEPSQSPLGGGGNHANASSSYGESSGSDADGDGADEAVRAGGNGRASEVLTAPENDAGLDVELGPNGTIVRRKHDETVLTAPENDAGLDVELGPNGTVVRQPRVASKQPPPPPPPPPPPAAAAEVATSCPINDDGDDDKGSEGDDESGDDHDDRKGQDEKSDEESEEESEELSSDEEEGDDGTLNSHERERARILRVTHNELSNMGAALRCPICLHTLRRPAVLPCFHAFCYDCIIKSLDAEKNLANRRKKSSKSPEITYCDKCPTCKIKITKRSINVSEHLEDVAKSFKMVLPTFGMAPIKYDPQVEMTQFVPSDATDDDDSMDDGDYNGSYGWGGGKGRKKSAGTDPISVAQHTQIAKAMLQALNYDEDDEDDDDAQRARTTRSASAAVPSASERMAKMQREMKKRAAQNKANDVERVVRGNEKVLIKAARKQHGANEERRRLDAAAASDGADASSSKSDDDVGKSGTIDTGSTTTTGIPVAAAKEPMGVDEGAAEKDGRETEKPLSGEEKAVAAAEQAGQTYLQHFAKKPTPKQQDRPWFRDSSVPNVDETEAAPSFSSPATSGSGNKKDISDITTDSTILREVAAVGLATSNDHARPSSPAHDKSPSASHDGEPPFEAQAADEDVEMMFGEDHNEDSAEMSDYCGGGATLTQDVREKEAADRSGELRDSQSERLQDLIDQMKEQDADRVEPGASQIGLSQDGDDDEAPSEQEDELAVKLQPVQESENEQSGEHDGVKDQEPSSEEPVAMDVADDTDDANDEANDEASDEAAVEDAAQESSPAPTQQEIAEEETPFDLVASPEKQGVTSTTMDSANLLSVGTVVQVKARMWAGVNKPGGVGRITKVHPSEDGTKYNVKYVLSGQEKDVDAIYVQAHEDGQEDFASPAKSRRGAADESAQTGNYNAPTRRGGRSRRAAASFKQAKENKTPSTSGYMPDNLTEDAALKKAISDSLQMENKTRARTSSLSQNSDQNDATSTATSACATKQKQKKGGTKRSKLNSKSDAARKPAAKKQKKATSPSADVSTLDSIPENMDVVEAVSVDMSVSTKLHLADVRYKELLENKRTINVTTSSLSRADKDALDDVIEELKKAGVTMKVMKEFKPNVTDLCITVRAETDDAPDECVLSKVRTLKAMRSALAGIPIVTPDWLRACLDEKAFVLPAENNCIRTLPPKSDITHLLPIPFDESKLSGPTAWLGVAKYAALLQRQCEGGGEQYEHRPLVNTSVLLCGQFKKGTGVPPKAELVTLLEDSGANVVSSVAAMNKKLKKAGEHSTPLVVLCDDAKSDKQSGISAPLSKAITTALEDQGKDGRIMVVSYMWLFDCVSCGELLDANKYKPYSPTAKSLWELSTAA